MLHEDADGCWDRTILSDAEVSVRCASSQGTLVGYLSIRTDDADVYLPSEWYVHDGVNYSRLLSQCPKSILWVYLCAKLYARDWEYDVMVMVFKTGWKLFSSAPTLVAPLWMHDRMYIRMHPASELWLAFFGVYLWNGFLFWIFLDALCQKSVGRGDCSTPELREQNCRLTPGGPKGPGGPGGPARRRKGPPPFAPLERFWGFALIYSNLKECFWGFSSCLVATVVGIKGLFFLFFCYVSFENALLFFKPTQMYQSWQLFSGQSHSHATIRRWISDSRIVAIIGLEMRGIHSQFQQCQNCSRCSWVQVFRFPGLLCRSWPWAASERDGGLGFNRICLSSASWWHAFSSCRFCVSDLF